MPAARHPLSRRKEGRAAAVAARRVSRFSFIVRCNCRTVAGPISHSTRKTPNSASVGRGKPSVALIAVSCFGARAPSPL